MMPLDRDDDIEADTPDAIPRGVWRQRGGDVRKTRCEVQPPPPDGRGRRGPRAASPAAPGCPPRATHTPAGDRRAPGRETAPA